MYLYVKNKMRKFVLLFVALLAFWSCSEKKGENEAEKAAKVYYGYLIDGKYENYVDAMVGSDSIPESYREQKITMIKQFVAQQKEERGGIQSVNVVRSVIDTVKTSISADVYLEVNFGDSIREEVVMPLILDKGKWKMQ